MKNETTLKIANKYADGIIEVYKDEEGYWAFAKDGYIFESTGCKTAHEYTQKDMLSAIRSLTIVETESDEINVQEVIEEVIVNLPLKRKDAIKAIINDSIRQLNTNNVVFITIDDMEYSFNRKQIIPTLRLIKEELL